MKTALTALGVCVLLAWQATAQVAPARITWADYQRALGTRTKYQNLVTGMPGPVTWLAASDQFWYRVSVEGGGRFVMVDANARSKQPAFDHERLAQALSTVTKDSITPVTLPFTTFEFADGKS